MTAPVFSVEVVAVAAIVRADSFAAKLLPFTVKVFEPAVVVTFVAKSVVTVAASLPSASVVISLL